MMITTESSIESVIRNSCGKDDTCVNEASFELASREGLLRASSLCALISDSIYFKRCMRDALVKMFRPLCENANDIETCFSRVLPSMFRRIPLIRDNSKNIILYPRKECVLHTQESLFMGSLSCCSDQDDILKCAADLIERRTRKVIRKVQQQRLLKFRNHVSSSSSKRVAFIEMTTSHSELLGVLIDLFQGWTVDTYIKNDDVKGNHYSSLTSFRDRIARVFETVSELRQEEYDAIVFLTGSQWTNIRPDLRTSIQSKTILVVHYLWEVLELSSSGAVLLPISPIFSRSIGYHVLSSYVPPAKNVVAKEIHGSSEKLKKEKNVLLVLGVRAEKILPNGTIYASKDVSDLVKFVRELSVVAAKTNLLVWLVARDKLNLSEILKPLINSYSNVFEWKSTCDSNCLEDIMMTRARYVHVLSKPSGDSYHHFRLTASIPHGLSFGVPFIVDQNLANIYGIESASLVYKNSSTEVISSLLHESSEYYESKRLACIGLRGVISRRNKQRFWGLY